MNVIKSPIVGDAGSVAVIAAEVVLQKYPLLATAVNPDVLTACHAAPPDTVAKVNVPDLFDSCNT
jgi:hypothetical protein